MNYKRHKYFFPDDILVTIEHFDKTTGRVLFDFVDSNEYRSFLSNINLPAGSESPSMVLLNNYHGKQVRESVIYSIKSSTVQNWLLQNYLIVNENSFLIGYVVNLTNFDIEVFNLSITISEEDAYWLNSFMYGQQEIPSLKHSKGLISVVVRSVGQANWNEVNFSNKTKIVFDAGAPYDASKSEVLNFISNKNTLYSQSKPILILSHWDKDHYHALVGMTNDQLRDNFSAFICRDQAPNLTSRILFGRIRQALGNRQIYPLSFGFNLEKGFTYFKVISLIGKQILIYNAKDNRDRNRSGLVLLVRTKDSSVILPADCYYQQISSDILPSINYYHKHYLIVPHHGGKAGKYCYQVPVSVKIITAAVSVGDKKKYGHPINTYINCLKKTGFSVKCTNRSGELTFNL